MINNMEKQDPIFADGAFFSRPRDGAPDFIKGNLSIEPAKFVKFLEAQKEHLSPKGWLNLDLKESKSGTLYFQVNTWKPLVKPSSLSEGDKAKIAETRDKHNEVKDTIEYPSGEINPEDVPF